MRYITPLQTPGVYVKEIDAFPPSVAQVATAIPAFIGFTENSTVKTPTRISSMLEYEITFGGPPPAKSVTVVLDSNNQAIEGTTFEASDYKLYNSMQLFYANGGGECYIVSIGDYSTTMTAALFTAGIDLLESFDEPTLILFPDAIGLPLEANPPNLPKNLGNVQQHALKQCAKLMDRFVIMDVREIENLVNDSDDFRNSVGNNDLKYGAAYYPYLKAKYNNFIRLKDINGNGAGKVDFSTLYDTLAADITTLVGMPTSTPDEIAAYKEAEAELVKGMPVWGNIISKLSQTVNVIPPSGAVAGIYAQVDASRGVWKAPANVSVSGIVGLNVTINDSQQGNMNVSETGKSINAIRSFFGKGELVWGARTLDGNSGDWRYINVRRLANMIEESVMKACMRFTFEPNVALTWVNVKGMIENFLITLWNDGALAGAKPEHAFFVQVGLGLTMTAQDIIDGKMVVKIGYAPVRPAEFIILEFKQMMQKS